MTFLLTSADITSIHKTHMYKLRHYNHEYVIVMQIPIIQRVVPLTRYYNNIVNSNGRLELGITWFGRLERGRTLVW